MLYGGWLGLVIISLLVSVAAFLWGMRSGQFADQGRARYLPLSSEPPLAPVQKSAKPGLELYVLMGVGLLGLLGMAASIVLSIYRM